MEIYQKAQYIEIGLQSTRIVKYLYMRFDDKTKTYAFKDFNKSTLINLYFGDSSLNKMDALITLYNLRGEDITKEEFDGNI